jgi:hypothetical protein
LRLQGKDFAVTYAQGRFHGMCQDMHLKIANPLAPVLNPERQVIARTPQGDVVSTTAAGEALFRCVANGQEFAAYVWAETTLTTSNFSPIRNWGVTGLASLIAPRAQAAQALRTLTHAARSFTLSPAWIASQAALSRQSTALVCNRRMRTWLPSNSVSKGSMRRGIGNPCKWTTLSTACSGPWTPRPGNITRLLLVPIRIVFITPTPVCP